MRRKIGNIRFAQEVPKEKIVFGKPIYTEKAFLDESLNVRDFRKQYRGCTNDGWKYDPKAELLWDEHRDIFDLLYLFDDEEIWEERAQLIEEEDDTPPDNWWSSDLHSDLEQYWYLKSLARRASKMEDQEDFQFEDLLQQDTEDRYLRSSVMCMDDDGVRLRYIPRLGYVDDAYDSGHDEPNEYRDPYPPVTGEKFLDIFKKEKRMKKFVGHLRRREHKRMFNETRDLCNQRRRRPDAAGQAGPSCSSH